MADYTPADLLDMQDHPSVRIGFFMLACPRCDLRVLGVIRSIVERIPHRRYCHRTSDLAHFTPWHAG